MVRHSCTRTQTFLGTQRCYMQRCKLESKWTRKNHKDQENRPEYKATRIVEIDEKNRLEKILESDSPVSIEVNTREDEKSPYL